MMMNCSLVYILIYSLPDLITFQFITYLDTAASNKIGENFHIILLFNLQNN